MLFSKYIRPLVLFLFLLNCTELFSQAACSYAYRKRITFDPDVVPGPADLVDFPVIIRLTNDNDLRVTGSGGHVQNTNGFDIIFTDEDGVTLLSHQLVSYTGSSGSLECWVKIPVLSTSIETSIYMYYGNSGTTTNQSSTATWSNGYAGVWHFDNNLNNSTPVTGLNGTNNGSSNTATALFGGNARSFNSGSSQYVDVSPYNAAYDLNANVTVSAWIRLGSTGADQKIAGNQNDVNGGWKFGVFSDNRIEFEIRNSSNSPFLSRSASGGATLSTNTWYYVVGQYSDVGDFIRTYLNGAQDRNYSTTAVCGASGGTMKIGREPFTSGAFFNGVIDELRVSNVIRSADWITTEYINQSSPGPGGLYTVSAEPKVWTGGTSTNFNTTSNWLNGSTPGSDDDVIINNGSNQPTLQGSIQLNSLYIRNGATLSLSNRRLSVRSDITNCGTISGNTGEIRCNSSNAFVQNQYFSGSGNYNLNDLTVANTFGTSPALILNRTVNVAGVLTLNTGIVYTSTANILALSAGASSTGGSANSHVSGPMSKTGTTSFIFPLGKEGRWRRAAISGISASSTFRAEYFNTAYPSTTPVSSPLVNVSSTEYWQIDRTAGSGNANVALYWEAANQSGITNCPDLTIARWSGSTWEERAATTGGGSSCTGTGSGLITTNAVVTAFSPFTFGSKLSGVNPLPIELTDFRAVCGNAAVNLSWRTASEKGNSQFILERSSDGNEWTDIAYIKGAGTSTQPKEYGFTDRVPGVAVYYYRLSQVDFDGKKETFPLIAVNCISSTENVRVYPNPAGSFVTLEFELSKDYGAGLIKITDNLGKTCLEQPVNLAKGTFSRQLSLNLPAGSYTILFSSDQLSLPPQKLIVH